MINPALEARSRAYVARSKYPVAAAVLTDKGIFTGIRAEVSSYASQAARMALGKALEAGATSISVMTIVRGTLSLLFDPVHDFIRLLHI